ncbi:MAG: dTMP kinase [Bacteroidota bacterium]
MPTQRADGPSDPAVRARPGRLVAFEGIDGAGKSTHIRRLATALEAAGVAVVTSREPTDGAWGQRLRASAQTGRLPLDEEIELFARDRAEHAATLIRPALEAGQVVILDRYFYSSIAYQGARGGDPAAIEARMRALAPTPDLVVLIDLDPDVALHRIAQGRGEAPNAFERREALVDIRQRFLAMAERCPEMAIVSGDGPAEAVHTQIRHVIYDRLLRGWASDEVQAQLRPAAPPDSR